MTSLLPALAAFTILAASSASGGVAEELGMEFVPIPAGTFLMGDPDSGAGSSTPAHEVTVGAFEMMTTEVTQAMWEAVTGYTIEEQRDRAHPSRMIYGAGPTWPVHYVSWPDCHEFIDLLNRMDGACTYRLPTEAEWEYACRAGSEASYYWGDDAVVIGDYCWTVSNSGYRMQPVGQLAPNAWGLYDMLGNALEMCEDQYHPGYTGAPSDGSAWVDGDPSDFRISRGGSFDLGESVCTCFRRFYETPGERQHYLGFRLVRTPN